MRPENAAGHNACRSSESCANNASFAKTARAVRGGQTPRSPARGARAAVRLRLIHNACCCRHAPRA
eukprot:5270160-Lingulodinium_polyedra.AAC.1